MALPRCLSSPSVSALINLCAILFITVNLLQNQYYLNERAINEHATMTMPKVGDHPTYPLLSNIDRSSTVSSSAAISLTIPQGKAVPMPSMRITDEEDKLIQRSFYGGKGDRPHLGGFTDFDCMGVSPSLWKHMVSHLGIKSVLDVGCGRGVSTSWFVTHELEFVQCVEGSHDAVLRSIVPERERHVIEHDFSRGPWWPDRTVDAAWAVEFTEHVGRNYQPNYAAAFRKAALIFVTHSNWGGWHHVEVHNDDWWRVRWEAAGLVYSEILTNEAREVAMNDQGLKNLTLDMREDSLYYVGQHIWMNIQVFINPMVASLPEHAHLFSEHGCFISQNRAHVDCNNTELAQGGKNLTPLPESFRPLILTEEMDRAWLDMIKDFPTSGSKIKKPRNNPK